MDFGVSIHQLRTTDVKHEMIHDSNKFGNNWKITDKKNYVCVLVIMTISKIVLSKVPKQ